MYGLRHQLLAGAVLSEQKHRGIGSGNPGGCGEQFGHGLAAPDYLGTLKFHRAVGRRVIVPGGGKLQGGLYLPAELAVVPQLGNEIERAQTHPLHSERYATPRRDKYHRRFGTQNLHFTQQLYPLLAGSGAAEIHIHHYKTYAVVLPYRGQCLSWSGDTGGFTSLPAQEHTERQPHGIVIVYNQYHDYKDK